MDLLVVKVSLSAQVFMVAFLWMLVVNSIRISKPLRVEVFHLLWQTAP